MGVDFYACRNCDETFPDCGEFYSCEQCGRYYCSTECADFSPIEQMADEGDEDYDEDNVQCGICSKKTPDTGEMFCALLKHFKISREDAIKIWREQDDDIEEEDEPGE